MYEITVERTFSAAHAISIGGMVEPLHGHNWLVRVTIAGDALDSDGLLCDFHTIDELLAGICAPFHNANLNTTEPFDHTNPTAENVARFIASEMARQIDGDDIRVASVSVGEAVGCMATYRPGKTS